jgi:hypothetical protein
MTSVRWYLEEYRNLVLTALIAAVLLCIVYVAFGPFNPARQARRHDQLVADCRARYEAAHNLADSIRVDVWPVFGPFDGRKSPERNDLFNCGALRRRGEL